MPAAICVIERIRLTTTLVQVLRVAAAARRASASGVSSSSFLSVKCILVAGTIQRGNADSAAARMGGMLPVTVFPQLRRYEKLPAAAQSRSQWVSSETVPTPLAYVRIFLSLVTI